MLPAAFVQELELDGNCGLWIGTQNGVVYVDKNDKWTVYTEEEGILPYSVDALEPDGEGGAWIGYYPDVKVMKKILFTLEAISTWQQMELLQL